MSGKSTVSAINLMQASSPRNNSRGERLTHVRVVVEVTVDDKAVTLGARSTIKSATSNKQADVNTG